MQWVFGTCFVNGVIPRSLHTDGKQEADVGSSLQHSTATHSPNLI